MKHWKLNPHYLDEIRKRYADYALPGSMQEGQYIHDLLEHIGALEDENERQRQALENIVSRGTGVELECGALSEIAEKALEVDS